MSRGFSRVILVGNLGRDPEMRYTQSGVPITNFSLAVGRKRRQPDGSYTDETNWFRVTLYRERAENAAEWLKKGNRVLVEGQLRIHTYTGQDGVERTSVDVDADNFQNLSPRGDDTGGSYGGSSRQAPGPERESARPTPSEQESGGRQPAADRPEPGSGGRQPAADRQDPFDDDDLDDVPF